MVMKWPKINMKKNVYFVVSFSLLLKWVCVGLLGSESVSTAMLGQNQWRYDEKKNRLNFTLISNYFLSDRVNLSVYNFVLLAVNQCRSIKLKCCQGKICFFHPFIEPQFRLVTSNGTVMHIERCTIWLKFSNHIDSILFSPWVCYLRLSVSFFLFLLMHIFFSSSFQDLQSIYFLSNLT